MPKFRRLKAELEAEFPDLLNITSEATRTTTGYFEVTVEDKLIHSKENGDGFVDNGKKYRKIADAVLKLTAT